jgi:hypothetical protein
MAEKMRSRPRRWWQRPHVSIGVLKLVVAFIGSYLAWIVDRSRRVATIDGIAPDVIVVGDVSHSPESLENALTGSSVKKAVFRVETSVPYSNLLRVVKAVESAGVHDIHFSSLGKPKSSLQAGPRPTAAESAKPGS